MTNECSYEIIAHSQGPWKLHKYLKKLGDKYIYPKGEYDTPKKEAVKTDPTKVQNGSASNSDKPVKSKIDQTLFKLKYKAPAKKEEKTVFTKKPTTAEEEEPKKEKKTKEKVVKEKTVKKQALKIKKLKTESKQEQIRELYKLARQANTTNDKKDRSLLVSRIRNTANKLGLDPEQFLKKQLK